MSRRGFLLALLMLGAPARLALAQAFVPTDWYTMVNAAQQNKTEDVKKFIAQGQTPNKADDLGRTPVSYAAGYGNIEMLQALIDDDARLDIRDKLGMTPLQRAVESNKTDCVRLLIDARSPLDAQDQRGMTALMLAADHGNLAIVKMLLAAGADANRQDYTGRSALGWAKGAEVVRALKSAGAH
jgi:ankyrin repeat protein